MLVIQRPTVEAIDEQVGNRQRFAISPLEPGFGHTLGNSLRRTLLSSIPGAAVTQVRFDDSLHEFTTIKGVTEDVTDIILNLKDLVLQVYSDEAVTLRLDAKGTGANTDVTAADIQPHPTSTSSTPTCTSPRSPPVPGSRSTSRSARAAATCRPSATRPRPRSA